MSCASFATVSRVTPGLMAAMIAFCVSSTQSYALRCASVKRPDTGHVRVMSVVSWSSEPA
jgi:hypothetical protein